MAQFLKDLLRTQRSLMVWAVLVLTVIAAWCVVNRQSISEYLRNYERRNQLLDEVRTLETQNAEYEQVRRVLHKGGFEKEKVARSRLQYIRPGEQVLHIEDQSDETTTSTSRP